MSKKQKRSIKQLKRQVKRLKTQIGRIISEIDEIKDASAASQTAPEPAAYQAARFTEEEVEMAMEATEDAEELAEMLEKKKH